MSFFGTRPRPALAALALALSLVLAGAATNALAATAKELGYTGDEPTGPWPTAPDTGLPALPDPGFGGGR